MRIILVFLLAMSGLFYGSHAMAAKCMLVMSYHQGYAWNDGVQRGVEAVLTGKCQLQIFYMDTKRNKTKAHAQAMALRARKQIDVFQPDVLIASDDNASRYLVAEYYKNEELPVVFCAVNWDVSKYGYPYKNVTGMIEVAPIQPLFEVAGQVLGEVYSIAYLGAKTFTEEKNASRVMDAAKKQGFNVNTLFAESVQDWQKMFIAAQQADVIFLGSNAGIQGWDNAKMTAYVKAHATKLAVTNHSWMAPYAMYAMTKVAEEQGEWAAEAALAIVNGLSPAKIPIRVNRKWQTYINTPLLEKAGLSINSHKFKDYIEVNGRSSLN